MLVSKLREAMICLKNLRVTLPYPFQPAPPAEGFRGRLELDISKCIGCGACINACPPRLIRMNDRDSRRTMEFALGRCTYCARCAEVCREKAIRMTNEFELFTEDKSDLNITAELVMAKCGQCGTAYTTQRIVDKLITQVAKEIGFEPAAQEWMKLCPTCPGGEVARAAGLAPYVGGARAAAMGTRLQAATMLGNTAISIPCWVAVALASHAGSGLAWAVLINAVLTGVIGTVILAMTRRSRLGAWLGSKIPLLASNGPSFDAALGEGTPWAPAILATTIGRAFQAVQYGVILLAVGGSLTIVSAFVSQAIHLVGAGAARSRAEPGGHTCPCLKLKSTK